MSNVLTQIQNRWKKSVLNKRETAEELNVSIATIDRLRKSGELKSKKVGGTVMFTINEIASFLEA